MHPIASNRLKRTPLLQTHPHASNVPTTTHMHPHCFKCTHTASNTLPSTQVHSHHVNFTPIAQVYLVLR
ncbi:hypothetical protein OG21DRAFT_1513061 [Imleria badia]|nr:hypothetical protein OG21DRAFT_1513061 [Imleria badia]